MPWAQEQSAAKQCMETSTESVNEIAAPAEQCLEAHSDVVEEVAPAAELFPSPAFTLRLLQAQEESSQRRSPPIETSLEAAKEYSVVLRDHLRGLFPAIWIEQGVDRLLVSEGVKFCEPFKTQITLSLHLGVGDSDLLRDLLGEFKTVVHAARGILDGDWGRLEMQDDNIWFHPTAPNVGEETRQVRHVLGL